MSCYTRHLAEFLPADPTAADKRALDKTVREVLGMRDADCTEVWEQVKVRRSESYFIAKVTEGTAGARARGVD